MTNLDANMTNQVHAADTTIEDVPGKPTPLAHFRLSHSVAAVLVGFAVLGAIACALGFWTDSQRAWGEVFVAGNFLCGLGLGALLLLALLYVTGACWSRSIQRIPEAMTSVIPIAGIAVFAALVCCPTWFGASTGEEIEQSPLHRLWFGRVFVLARAIGYLALWIAFAAAIVVNSRRQDQDNSNAPTDRNRRLSAVFLVVFGITCWLATTDWLMSLQGNWASTAFPVYNFAGIFLSALAGATVLVVVLRHHPSLRAHVTAAQLHDLGTLLFSMSCFWMYVWFCQYLLIWYVNNPEETAYFRIRQEGDWPLWLYASLALNWAIPFVVLLPRVAKQNPWILGTVASLVVVGRWIDLSLVILPTQGASLRHSALVIDVGCLLGTVCIFLLAFFWCLKSAPLIPGPAKREPA
jgi:hypothetical protein